MTPLPKRRIGKGAQARRRSHLALRAMALDICPQCKSVKRAHHVCPTCGTYHGIEVIDIEEKAAKSQSE